MKKPKKKPVWESKNPTPKTNGEKMTSAEKAKAKRTAKKAGRLNQIWLIILDYEKEKEKVMPDNHKGKKRKGKRNSG